MPTFVARIATGEVPLERKYEADHASIVGPFLTLKDADGRSVVTFSSGTLMTLEVR